MTREGSSCGAGLGSLVMTERQPNITVEAGGGTDNANAVGPAVEANDVSFTIVFP